MQGFPKRLQPFDSVNKSARTANQPLSAADNGQFIDITSGTFTQTFDGSISDGWYCLLRNSGTGDITIPVSDGLTNWVMYPNEVRFFQSTSGILTSFVITPFFRKFTASGTFTKPPGYAQFGGILWSGGCSGQRTNNVAVLSLGGCGGGAFPIAIDAATIGATVTVTIGAGGAAVSGVAGGNVGGSTSFGTYFVVSGGTTTVGGAISNLAGRGTAPYCLGFESAAVATLSSFGVWGGGGVSSNGTSVGNTDGVHGAACGGSVTAAAALVAAGTATIGGNGGAASSASNGTDGSIPGGGGGATQTGTQSGAGGRGELRVWGVV